MNVLVLNGSPKGKDSITLQTVLYLEKRFPLHAFSVLHVGQRIRAIEKDFSEAKAALENADLLLFCYPVYTFLVPSQLHRFLELIQEHNVPLSGKYAAQQRRKVREKVREKVPNFFEENIDRSTLLRYNKPCALACLGA